MSGRVALVTGGGRGIGQAISLGLAADGATVAVNYRRDAEAAEQTVKEIETAGGTARTYQASVDSRDECAAMTDAVVADFGAVDILVNNAGIASRGQSVKSTDPDEFERVLRIHAMGSFWMCQAVIPSMRERPRGDVVFISSVATDQLAARGAPYNMAKAAEEALALTLAKEEVANGIRVNIVAPGLVDTEMGRRLVKGAAGIEDIRTLDGVMPLARVCTPDDVAGVVRFLVSDAGSYITGARIRVDGGVASLG
ncbi:MAG: glucose 1-dehydrogenase [Actinobacteria bacterium]|nr:glucose 1-dehydrogenase [Actinomycetota bacterium]